MIHPTAVIGDPPEHRDFQPDQGAWYPDIDDTARIEAFVTVDAGVFRRTKVGARTWCMKKTHIGHDAIIGRDCEIAPLTSVGGEVTIGNRVKVGQGATFKPQVTVGDGARIGMGAVVTKDVPAGETWVGNPARKLEKKQPFDYLTESEEEGWEEIAAAAERQSDDELYGEWFDRSRAAA